MRAAAIAGLSAPRGSLPDRLAAETTSRPAVRAAAAHASRGARSLVVELYGPPAAGKTTLALALGVALRQEGLPVRVVTSARPAERIATAAAGPGAKFAAPFLRALKLVGAVRALLHGAAPAPVAELMDALYPAGRVRRMRLRRYAINLDRAWRDALAGDSIVVFDQGFLNLLCSLALSARATDRKSLARGLSLIRAPDIAVLLDAPRHVIGSRLTRRLGSQTRLERLLENDVERGFLQAELATVIDGILRERGARVVRVSSHDRTGLSSAVSEIAREIRSCMEGARC